MDNKQNYKAQSVLDDEKGHEKNKHRRKSRVADLHRLTTESYPRRWHLKKELKGIKWVLVGYTLKIILGLIYKEKLEKIPI